MLLQILPIYGRQAHGIVWLQHLVYPLRQILQLGLKEMVVLQIAFFCQIVKLETGNLPTVGFKELSLRNNLGSPCMTMPVGSSHWDACN